MALRFPIAMVLGVVTYLVAMAMTVYDGILSLIFQPIIAVILTAAVCTAMLIIASPLLIGPVWRVWRRVWPVPLLLVLAGIASMITSWHPALRIQVWNPELQMQVDSFQPALAIAGWLAMLFGVLWMPKITLTKDGRWA